MRKNTKILGIFYIVFGALGLLGIPLIFVHKWFMRSLISSMAEVDPNALEMLYLIEELMAVMIPALIALSLCHVIFNVLVGYCFIKHKAYYSCYIAAVFTLLAFPYGTVLGVFSIIVLTNDEAKRLWGKT